MTTIKINGVKITIDSGNIKITNNKCFVDGKEIEFLGGEKHVTIEGDVNNIECEGSVTVNGNVHGDVQAGGSVRCEDIGNDVQTGGSLKAKKIGGDIMSGGSVSVS